ncbi:MAG: hypothetical protein ACEQSL_02870 [Sediminibacterium sp.]
MKNQRTALAVLIILTSLCFYTKKGLEWFASDTEGYNHLFGLLSYHIFFMGVLPLAGWILLKYRNNA